MKILLIIWLVIGIIIFQMQVINYTKLTDLQNERIRFLEYELKELSTMYREKTNCEDN